jgi:coatomer subunit gamma
MRDVTDQEIVQAVHVLQLFLTSPRAVTKFAAIRILHNFASFKRKPLLRIGAISISSNRCLADAVRSCNPDIEV